MSSVLTEIQMQRGQTLVHIHRSGNQNPGGFQNLLKSQRRLEESQKEKSLQFLSLPFWNTLLCVLVHPTRSFWVYLIVCLTEFPEVIIN